MITIDKLCHVSTCKNRACLERGACTGQEFLQSHALAHIRARADRLIADAAQWGLVVTIERQAVQPLAMGNTVAVVDVREARKAAA